MGAAPHFPMRQVSTMIVCLEKRYMGYERVGRGLKNWKFFVSSFFVIRSVRVLSPRL